MKIGLVRHFKVNKAYPKGRVTAEEVEQWFAAYDAADIEEGSTELEGVDWHICYASDLPRAVRTAELIFPGPMKQTPEFREIAAPVFHIRWKLPIMLWGLLIRFAWWCDPGARQNIKLAKLRIQQALNSLIERHPEENVLIVSHAALMKYIRKDLTQRGFTGPGFGIAENGKLYIFEMKK
jgi:broad specificity phosphatase PhoE